MLSFDHSRELLVITNRSVPWRLSNASFSMLEADFRSAPELGHCSMLLAGLKGDIRTQGGALALEALPVQQPRQIFFNLASNRAFSALRGSTA
jgi:hypothetical protein